MKTFREFQFSWLLFSLTVPIQILVIVLYFYPPGRALGATDFMVTQFTFGLVYLLFYGMTTTIDDEVLTVSFGVGLIHRNISLRRINETKTVKTPWYYGWGIRFIPNGMLFNVSGADGVELGFIDSSRIFRIGSQDSRRLRDAILASKQQAL